VKFSVKDTWRCIANSIFESTRNKEVKYVYVLFGKMGGEPDVDWDTYEACVMHVRTSHVPRFEVEIGAEESLFRKIDVPYSEFCLLSMPDKMAYIRQYARGRLKDGDRLWWLEDNPEEQSHSLSLEVKLYMNLTQGEKRKLRSEAALLCPQIVKPSRAKHKYDDVALYALTYRGILCSQVRDLFSAGSVAHRNDARRGGLYIIRALKDIEDEMRNAALHLDDALFLEYWGESIAPHLRISTWLAKADELAQDWVPSRELFVD